MAESGKGKTIMDIDADSVIIGSKVLKIKQPMVDSNPPNIMKQILTIVPRPNAT